MALSIFWVGNMIFYFYFLWTCGEAKQENNTSSFLRFISTPACVLPFKISCGITNQQKNESTFIAAMKKGLFLFLPWKQKAPTNIFCHVMCIGTILLHKMLYIHVDLKVVFSLWPLSSFYLFLVTLLQLVAAARLYSSEPLSPSW